MAVAADRTGPGGTLGAVSRQIRFGYKVSAEQFGPSDLLDFTVVAEQCGFDTAAISDHFQPWRHPTGHAPFSLAWLERGRQGDRAASRSAPVSSLPPSDITRRSWPRRWAPSALCSPVGSGLGWGPANR